TRPTLPDAPLDAHGFARRVRLWDIANRRLLGPPLKTPLVDLALDRAGTMLATVDGGLDGTVRLWDVASGRPLGAPLRYGHGLASIEHVAIDAEGTTLAAGAQAPLGHVKRWSAPCGSGTSSPASRSAHQSTGTPTPQPRVRHADATKPDPRTVAAIPARDPVPRHLRITPNAHDHNIWPGETPYRRSWPRLKLP